MVAHDRIVLEIKAGADVIASLLCVTRGVSEFSAYLQATRVWSELHAA